MTPLPSYTWVLETEHFNSKRRLVSCVFGGFFFFGYQKAMKLQKQFLVSISLISNFFSK